MRGLGLVLLLALFAVAATGQGDPVVQAYPLITITALEGKQLPVYSIERLGPWAPEEAPASTLALHADKVLALVHIDPDGVLARLRLTGEARINNETFYVFRGEAYNASVTLIIGDLGHFLVDVDLPQAADTACIANYDGLSPWLARTLTGVPNATGPVQYFQPFAALETSGESGGHSQVVPGWEYLILVGGLPLTPTVTAWCVYPGKSNGYLAVHVEGFAPRLVPRPDRIVVNETVLDAIIGAARSLGLEGDLYVESISLAPWSDRLVPLVTVTSSSVLDRASIALVGSSPWAVPYNSSLPPWDAVLANETPVHVEKGAETLQPPAEQEPATCRPGNSNTLVLATIISIGAGALGALAALALSGSKGR